MDANSPDSSKEQLRAWADLATQDWHTNCHPGWSVLTEPVEWVNSMVPPAGLAGALGAGAAAGTSIAAGAPGGGSSGGASGGAGGFSFPSSTPAPIMQQQYPPVNAPGMPLLHPPGSINSTPSIGPVLRSGSGYGLPGSGGSVAPGSAPGSGGGALQQQPSQGLGGVNPGFGHPLQMPNPSTSGSHLQPGLPQMQQQQHQQFGGGAYPPVTGFMPHQQQQQQQMMPQPMVPGSPPAQVPTFVPVFTPHLQHQGSLGSQMNQQQGGMGLVSQPTHSGSGSWAQQMHSAHSHGAVSGGGAGGGMTSPLMQHHHSASMPHSTSVTVTPNEEGEDVALIHTSGSGYAGAMSQPLLGEVNSQPTSHAVSAPAAGSFLQKQPVSSGPCRTAWEEERSGV